MAEWVDVKFVMFDYAGKAQAVPALSVGLKDVDTDEVVEQCWSMGKASDWMPAPDGKSLIKVGKADSLGKNSNGMLLLTSLLNAGFDEAKISDDITVLSGMVAHMIRVPAPERKGLAKTVSAEGREQTILIVDKIERMPWEKPEKGAKAGVAGKGKGKAKTAEKAPANVPQASDVDPATDDIEGRAINLVMELISEGDGSCTKKELMAKGFQRMKDDPDRQTILNKFVFQDAWLGSEGVPWTLEAGVVSMG